MLRARCHLLAWSIYACTLVLGACVPPITPMQRLTDAAYDLNLATRFGRMDVAMPYVAPDAQAQFARHHALWGNTVRVVDLDLVSLRALDQENVAVDLLVAWHSVDDMTVRQSQITQRWQLERDDWRLVEELRSGGAPGLFPGHDGAPKTQARAATEARTPE